MSDEDHSGSNSDQQANPNASPPDPACPSLDEARELRIRHSLAACFDIGMLLSTLDFQLRFAYLAWNPNTFQAATATFKAATATWRQLSLKVQEAVADPALQDELREIVGRHENRMNDAFFSESHADHLDDVLRDTRASGWYSSATDEQICQETCRIACPFRVMANQLLESIERYFSEVQLAFIRLGLLADEGTHSDDIPLDVFDLPSPSVPTGQDDLPSSSNSKGWGVMTSDASSPQTNALFCLPRKVPDTAPPHDQDRWIEEVKNRCRLIHRDFSSSWPKAFDVTLDHQASVEQIANAIRGALEEAHWDENSYGSGQAVKGNVDELATEAYVFRKGNKGWSIKYGTEEPFSVKHLKGLTYIREMLSKPKTIHTPESLAMAEGHPGDDALSRADVSNASPSDVGGISGDEDFDSEALQAFHEQVREINIELDKASRLNDLAEQQRLEKEKQDILSHIKKSRGLGGRVATATTDHQRRFRAVRKCIKTALKEIGGHSKCCEKHLRNTINLDHFCYDPDQEIRWRV